MNLPTAQLAKGRVFSAKDIRGLAILAGICLAVMSTLLFLTALFFTTYDVRGSIAPRLYNPFSVTAVGIYIITFLTANAALSQPSFRPGALLAILPAILAGWAIVAGPLYGWLIMAGVYAAIIVSYVLSGGTLLIVILLAFTGPLIGPLVTGCATGSLVHFAARTIAGQPLWDRGARKEALLHCLGFLIGAFIVYLAVGGINKELSQLRGGEAGLLVYVGVLWPVFLGAPAAHLACFAFARWRFGWPEGAFRAKRLLVFSLALFVIVGTVRSLVRDDPAMFLTWPVKDLHKIQFWKNHPRRDAPLTVGEYQIVLNRSAHPQYRWNRELQQYDYFLFGVSEDAWPLPESNVRPLVVRLREMHPLYVAVRCDFPADYGLLLCRPREQDEEKQPGDRSVPAYWVEYDYEIYAPPQRPDVVLGRRASFRSESSNAEEHYDLSLAFTESHSPKASVLLSIVRFELARWPEALNGFDQVVEHHLRRADPD